MLAAKLHSRRSPLYFENIELHPKVDDDGHRGISMVSENFRVAQRNMERICNMASTKQSPSVAPDRQTPLQLPYDRLETPEMTVVPASLAPARQSWRTQEALSGADDDALILAACAGLLYRYSGQATIPLLLVTGPPNDALRCRALHLCVSGTRTLSNVQTDVLTELARRPVDPVDHNVAVLVSISRPGVIGQPTSAAELDSVIKSDIHFRLKIEAGNLESTLEYNSTLFEKPTVQRLLDHFLLILKTAIHDPSISLSAIPLFPASELRWIEEHCVGRSLAFENRAAHRDVEDYALRDPQKIAVKFRNLSLTYQKLNQRSNQLARYLLSVGVKQKCRVVVCVEPSLEVAITLLAILKAGGTYVPLNPTLPQSRRDAIIEDVAPTALITQAHLSELMDRYDTVVVLADRLPDGVSEQSFENLAAEPDFRQTAYIFYTSGTTGKPKGVMVSHANLTNLIGVSRDRYQITPTDVMPAVASFSFSISMYELMSPLTVGGTLVVLDREHVLDAKRMARTLQEVTMFHIGPSLLKNVIRYIKTIGPDRFDFSGVRHASSGGDMVADDLLQNMRQCFSAAEIYVIYGCSEITLMGCTWELPGDSIGQTFVGRPFANTHLLVLDDDNNQVPIGAIGDVCFGGDGVALGYLNQPRLTDELFFRRDDISFYRTGDRGKLTSDGNLKLLGRRDFQIQLYGMRIELAEIEFHLRQADGVSDAVVAAKTRPNGDDVLVGYCVSGTGRPLDIGMLREHMIDRLPYYMVPRHFVELAALPLNVNLKVDRRSLPDYYPVERLAEHPPETKTEKAIAGIWEELLRLEFVSLEDNFLMLGGDSVLAMEMIFLVSKQVGFHLDGMDVVRESLQVLAAICDNGTAHTAGTTMPDTGRSVHRTIDSYESLFFGPGDSLYGVFHATTNKPSSAVLICPPVGQEQTRCQYFLKTLAANLAAQGVAVFRFDFYGCADSLGRDVDASPTRWLEDVQHAYQYLQSRTDCDRITVLGVRLGAALAAKALGPDENIRWVFWDALADGRVHYERQKRMHIELIQELLVIRNLKRPKAKAGIEELLGFTYSQNAIDELQQLQFSASDAEYTNVALQVFTADIDPSSPAYEKWLKAMGRNSVDRLPENCRWYSAASVTSAITFKNIARHLIRSISEKSA